MRKNIFSKTKQVLTLDMGSSYLKLALIDFSGFRTKLLKREIKRVLEKDVQNKDFIKSAIQEFLKDEFSPKNVYIALSYPDIQIERVELPHMPAKEVPEAAIWKIKDRISATPDTMIIDSYVSDEIISDDGSKKHIVTVVVTSREVVNRFMSIFQSLHIEVAGINAIPVSLANILKYNKNVKSGDTVCCVEIGARHSYVSIYKGYKLVFLRTVPVSSDQITNSMTGVLISDKGRIELPKEKAEDFKVRYGLPLDNQKALEGDIMGSQLIALIRPILEQLVSEIDRTFAFYTGQLNGENPKDVYFTGGGSRLKNMVEFLSKQMSVPVHLLKLPEQFEDESGDGESSLLSFLGIIGVALPSAGKQINLIPPELVREKAELIGRYSVRAVGILVLGLLLISYLGIKAQITSYKKRMESARSHREMLLKVKEMHDMVSHREEAVAKIKQGQIPGELLLKEIGYVVTDNIILDNLLLNMDNGIIKFYGTLYPQTKVIEDEMINFMEIIEESVFFEDANLISVKKVEIKNVLVVKFEIRCSIRQRNGQSELNGKLNIPDRYKEAILSKQIIDSE